LPAGGQTGPCLSCDRLLDRGPWEELARELMAEVIAAANAQGLPLPADTAERQISRTRYMGPYKASTLLDFEKGQSLEVDSLFAEPLRRAGQAGVATPRLAALCRLMRALDEKLRRTQ